MFGTCDTKRGVQLWRALVMAVIISGLLVLVIIDLTSTAGAAGQAY